MTDTIVNLKSTSLETFYQEVAIDPLKRKLAILIFM